MSTPTPQPIFAISAWAEGVVTTNDEPADKPETEETS